MGQLMSVQRTNQFCVATLWSDIALGIVKEDPQLPIRLAITRHLEPQYSIHPEWKVPDWKHHRWVNIVHCDTWIHCSIHLPLPVRKWIRRFERDPALCEPIRFQIEVPVQHTRHDNGRWSKWVEEEELWPGSEEWTRYCDGCSELFPNKELDRGFCAVCKSDRVKGSGGYRYGDR